jgi:hypothetical protein
VRREAFGEAGGVSPAVRIDTGCTPLYRPDPIAPVLQLSSGALGSLGALSATGGSISLGWYLWVYWSAAGAALAHFTKFGTPRASL